MKKLQKYERNTKILYNEVDDSFVIDSSVQKHIQKFDELGYECIGEQRYSDGTLCSKEYKVPTMAISFGSLQ